MPELDTILRFLNTGGVVAVLVTLAVPSLKKKIWGNGNDEIQTTKDTLAQLAETANHSFTILKDEMKEHKEDDREFFKEQREFNRDLWEKLK